MTHAETMRWAGWAIVIAWAVWLIGWMLAGLGAKAVARRESPASAFSHGLPLVLAIALLVFDRASAAGRILGASPATAWLFDRFIAPDVGLIWSGVPLVAAGLLVTLWARWHLGGNWSGAVTIKRAHTLVRSGPYRFARHPIYTGLLIAMAGTATACGEWRGVLAFALILLGFWYKSGIEERLLREHFGPAYQHYQRDVKRLIPYLL